jgi:hypothetical protein
MIEACSKCEWFLEDHEVPNASGCYIDPENNSMCTKFATDTCENCILLEICTRDESIVLANIEMSPIEDLPLYINTAKCPIAEEIYKKRFQEAE